MHGRGSGRQLGIPMAPDERASSSGPAPSCTTRVLQLGLSGTEALANRSCSRSNPGRRLANRTL
eukprot:4325672-Prymnesium_polylepis.1